MVLELYFALSFRLFLEELLDLGRKRRVRLFLMVAGDLGQKVQSGTDDRVYNLEAR